MEEEIYKNWTKTLKRYKKREICVNDEKNCLLFEKFEEFSEKVKEDFDGDIKNLFSIHFSFFFPFFTELLSDNKIEKVELYMNQEMVFCLNHNIKDSLVYKLLMIVQAKIYVKKDDFKKAEPIIDEVLPIFENEFGIDSLECLAVLDVKSDILYLKGEFQLCYDLSKNIYENYKMKFGELDERTLVAETKMQVYFSSITPVVEVLSLEKQLLEKKLKVFGPMHPETLLTENNYLDVLIDINDETKTGIKIEDLKHSIEDLLQKQKEVTGKETWEVYRTKASLARFYYNNNEEEKALKMQYAIYEFFKKVYGPNNLKTMNIQTEIVNTITYLGRTEIALSLQEQIVKKYKTIFGFTHPNTLDARYNFFVILYILEDYQMAEEVISSLVLDFRQVLGEDTITTLNAEYMHAKVCHELNKEDEALEILKKIEVFEAKLEDTKVLNYRFLAVQILMSKGDYTNALNQMEKLKNTKDLENLEYDLEEIYEMEVVCYKELEKFDKALVSQEKLIDSFKDFGEDDLRDEEAAEEKGNLMIQSGKLNEALDLFYQNIQKAIEKFGEDSMEVNHFKHNYAITLYEQEMFEEAFAVQREVVRRYEDNFGKDDNLTIQAEINMILILKALGREKETLSRINNLKQSLESDKIDKKFSQAISSLTEE
ncbi:MAG: tetratricopeptide repeat protein [Sphaerochaetaceae bacterium]